MQWRKKAKSKIDTCLHPPHGIVITLDNDLWIQLSIRMQGSFGNDDGDGKENVINKHLPNCDYLRCPILFAFHNVGKVRSTWTGERAVKLNTEN